MSQYDNNMTGALFPNKNKERGDNRPHYTGSIEVNGTKYSLAGWKKLDRNEKPYMSLKISEWRDSEKGDGGSRRSRQPEPEFDDDIPF